jgi:hypothetical protein
MIKIRAKDGTKNAIALISQIVTLFVIIAYSNAGCTNLMLRHIHVSDLESQRCEVVGRLGVPLGWAVRVEAVVVDGKSTGEKEFFSDYLLDIISINGRTQQVPLRMTFSDRTYQMPRNHFERYKDVEGHSTGTLDSETIDRINKGYVGNRYDLLIYEEGYFTGPRLSLLPKDIMTGQGEGYGFNTSVCIRKVYKGGESIKKNNEENDD